MDRVSSSTRPTNAVPGASGASEAQKVAAEAAITVQQFDDVDAGARWVEAGSNTRERITAFATVLNAMGEGARSVTLPPGDGTYPHLAGIGVIAQCVASSSSDNVGAATVAVDDLQRSGALKDDVRAAVNWVTRNGIDQDRIKLLATIVAGIATGEPVNLPDTDGTDLTLYSVQVTFCPPEPPSVTPPDMNEEWGSAAQPPADFETKWGPAQVALPQQANFSAAMFAPSHHDAPPMPQVAGSLEQLHTALLRAKEENVLGRGTHYQLSLASKLHDRAEAVDRMRMVGAAYAELASAHGQFPDTSAVDKAIGKDADMKEQFHYGVMSACIDKLSRLSVAELDKNGFGSVEASGHAVVELSRSFVAHITEHAHQHGPFLKHQAPLLVRLADKLFELGEQWKGLRMPDSKNEIASLFRKEIVPALGRASTPLQDQIAANIKAKAVTLFSAETVFGAHEA